MGLNLIQECQRSLALVQEDVEDGILYLDAGAGEASHFNGGLPSLLELGARAICSLEQASPLDAAISWRGTQNPLEKIAILTSRLLIESHQDVIRCLCMHPSVKHCTIWTSISEEAHSAHPDTSFGLDAFHDYKNSLLRDLERTASEADTVDEARHLEDENISLSQQSAPRWQAPDIEIKHFPMMVCSFTKSLFVFPSGGSVAEAPLSDHRDVCAVSRGIPGIDVTVQTGGEEHIPAGATLLAHSLQHVAAQMDLKFEVFTLGPLAHVVGKMMSGLSSPPEVVGHPRRPAGLVLIDRSQDLITPSSHGDSLLDRIFSSLPKRTFSPVEPQKQVLASTIVRPPMDLRIPVNHDDEKVGGDATSRPCFPFFPVMNIDNNGNRQTSFVPARQVSGVSPLTSSPELPGERAELMGGSLSMSGEQKSTEYLESLLGKRTKDSVLQIRKWLQDSLRQEKINVPGKGRLGAVNVNELRTLRAALAEKPEVALRHMALIQLTRAAEVALGPHWGPHWEAFAGAQRILMLSAGDRTQSLALQLQDIVQQCAHSLQRLSLSVNSPSTDMLSLRDALTLAIVVYGLAGEDMQSESLGGPFTWEEEQALKEAVVETILQGSQASPLGFLKGLESCLPTFEYGADTRQKSSPDNVPASQNSPSTDEEWDRWEGVDTAEDENTEEYGGLQLKLELRDRLEEVFSVLHKVATACSRGPLQELPLPVENQSNFGELHVGLVYKLVSLIFAKADISGLEHHASGMGRFFKGGLGRFGIRQAKPKLSDQRVLLLFFIGGLNFVEVREAREAQAAFPSAEGVELLLGGTTLLTPSDMYDLLLGSCGSV